MKTPLFCILGQSGAGKTSICTSIEQGLNMKQIPSYTTRPPRFEGERGHTFVTDKEYSKLKNILAENTTTGYKYCVTEEQINGDYDLYVVDYSGLKMLKDKYKGQRDICSIFIAAPLRERYDRLFTRYLNMYDENTRACEEALKRIVSDAKEFEGCQAKCRYVVNNLDGEFHRAVDRVKEIILSEMAGVDYWH